MCIRDSDLDYLIEMMDWPANVDPEFAEHRHFFPRPVRSEAEMADFGYCEKWVVYSTANYSAKELTVFPNRAVTMKDAAAYGLILTLSLIHIWTGNLNRDKPLLCGLFTAPSRLLSEAGQIAGQCLQWQIPLLTEVCLTESACFILSRYLIRFRTAPVPAMLLSRCLHDSTSAPKMAAAKMRLLVRLRTMSPNCRPPPTGSVRRSSANLSLIHI